MTSSLLKKIISLSIFKKRLKEWLYNSFIKKLRITQQQTKSSWTQRSANKIIPAFFPFKNAFRPVIIFSASSKYSTHQSIFHFIHELNFFFFLFSCLAFFYSLNSRRVCVLFCGSASRMYYVCKSLKMLLLVIRQKRNKKMKLKW